MLELDDDGVMAEINMTPLVDVMLVLLIIFMITMPVITRQIDVTLPASTSAVPATEQQTYLVQVRTDGQWTLDGTAVTPQALAQQLADAVHGAPDTRVHLAGDTAVDYGEMMRVMDVLRGAGVTNLGFVTDADGG
jgi:biopolymer transport protein ExbD